METSSFASMDPKVPTKSPYAFLEAWIDVQWTRAFDLHANDASPERWAAWCVATGITAAQHLAEGTLPFKLLREMRQLHDEAERMLAWSTQEARRITHER